MHKYLTKKNKHYANWHKHELHAHTHWTLFISIAVLASSFLISSVDAASKSISDLTKPSPIFRVVPISKKPKVEPVQGHILVKFKDGISNSKKEEVLTKHKLKEKNEIKGLDVKILSIDPGDTPEEVVSRIKNADQANIEFAEIDEILPPSVVPNDPLYGSEWHLAKTNASGAWDIGSCNGSVVIAILDTGIDSAHSDLAQNVLPGWNFYNNTGDTSDIIGHGSAVAGIATASTNNANGVSSYGWDCKILPLEVGDATGYATFSNIAAALTYAADHGARVANISYKVSGSAAVTSAAQYFQSKAKGVVTSSAGNEGDFITTADNPYILTVSATTQNDTLATWSTRGNHIDVSAPGEYIYTTDYYNSYSAWNGTSFASPIVAGIAALVISANPSLTATQIQDIIKSSADDLGTTGWDSMYGTGRVNAGRAVALAKSYVATSPSPSPTTSPVPTVSPTPTVSPSPSISPSPLPVVSLTIPSYTISTKSATQATITWKTSIASTGLVSYGTNSAALNSSVSSSASGTTHTVTLSGLTAFTKYYIKINAVSLDGTLKTSTASSFKTARR